MRILFVTWNYPPKLGGMEILLAHLVENLRRHASVRVLGPYADSTSDITRERADVLRPARDGLAWFAMHAFSQGSRLLRHERFDVVFGGSALTTPIVYTLGRVFGVPPVLYAHGLDLIYSHSLYQQMIKHFLPRCAKVFTNSRASRQEALNRGVLPDRISVLHPGLDFSEFEAIPDTGKIREKFGLRGRPVLLSVGRLAKRKGLVEFVRHSLPAIVKRHPDVIFVVVGGNPIDSLTHKEDVKSQIETEARRRNLQYHVRLLGWIERGDLVRLYHACNVFVLPAINVAGDMEGFGIVLIEAGAAGKPVVSTKLGGITDAVVDGKSGILVEAEEWKEISDAVSALLSDSRLQRQLGQFGRKRARRELDWPVIAEECARQLRQLVETHHR
jgi:phosphatidylinositol alpha-1,6-mannosyltransferase